MKRNWNWAVWAGASLVFLGVISYPLFFVRFPALRDFPWANLPISVFAVLALALSGFFLYGIFIGAEKFPAKQVRVPECGNLAPSGPPAARRFAESPSGAVSDEELSREILKTVAQRLKNRIS